MAADRTQALKAALRDAADGISRLCDLAHIGNDDHWAIALLGRVNDTVAAHATAPAAPTVGAGEVLDLLSRDGLVSIDKRDKIDAHLTYHVTDGRWHDDCWWCRQRRVFGGTGVSVYDAIRSLIPHAERAVEPTCTGLTSSWCPVHGDCACPREHGDRTFDAKSCPLHSTNSGHADPLAAAERAQPAPQGAREKADAIADEITREYGRATWFGGDSPARATLCDLIAAEVAALERRAAALALALAKANEGLDLSAEALASTRDVLGGVEHEREQLEQRAAALARNVETLEAVVLQCEPWLKGSGPHEGCLCTSCQVMAIAAQIRAARAAASAPAEEK